MVLVLKKYTTNPIGKLRVEGPSLRTSVKLPSSENIPSTLKDCYITFLGFSSSKLNDFLFVDSPFKDSFLHKE